MWYRFLQFLVSIPLLIFYPTRAIGKKQLPKKDGYIISCNHRTNVDGFLLGILIFRRQVFLGKKEWFDKRFIGFLLRKCGFISVNRGAPDLSVIKKSVDALNKNKIVTIFPEGTRNKTGEEMQELKKGIILIALKAKKPIVPMYFQKRPRFLRCNKLFIGEPIYFNDFYDKKITKEILDEGAKILEEKMLSLQ